MHVTITCEDVTELIVAEVEYATGKDCEVFTNETGSVILYDRHTVIARVTPLSSVIDVTPLCGPFVDEITDIPPEAETIGSLKEIAHVLDRAASHALSAALNH